jgi:uncharacterized protein (DUF952 family)/mannose-6-phosphate isomerase-like protein (cupin superfamily)
MPKLIGKATRVVEVDGLAIDEYVGNVGSNTDDISIAVVKISEPTSEPWLTADYDEWIVVLKGRLEVHYGNGQALTANGGETIFIEKGERFRPIFPEGGTEYVPVCIPAFKPERCQREEENGVNTSEVSAKLEKLHSNNKKKNTDENPNNKTLAKIVYHMCQKTLWEKHVASGTAYFPPTFDKDGYFTHATAVPSRLLETANHFYTSTEGQWICLELSTENLKVNGIITLFEEPKSVGEQEVRDNWKSSEWHCPHVFGGIPVNVPGIVTNIFDIERDGDGKFISLVGLTDRE